MGLWNKQTKKKNQKNKEENKKKPLVAIGSFDGQGNMGQAADNAI